jgi:hypothetical protein
MADNVPLTPGAGVNIAAEEINVNGNGIAQVQFVKVLDGSHSGYSPLIINSNGEIGVKAAKSSSVPLYTGGTTAVGTTAVQIAAFNSNRMQLCIVNSGTVGNIFLRPAQAGTISTYLVKLAVGDYYELCSSGFCYIGSMYAISDNAAGQVNVTEFAQ